MGFGFFKRTKSKKNADDLANVSFMCKISKKEIEFIRKKALEHCSSQNAVIRMCIHKQMPEETNPNYTK